MFTPMVPNHTCGYSAASSDLDGPVYDKCGRPSTRMQLWEQPDTGTSTIRCGRDRCFPNPSCRRTGSRRFRRKRVG